MASEADAQAGDKVYVVVWQDHEDERSDEVPARNAGEAVWLVHARHHDAAGARYTVRPADNSEPPRNFTVGQARPEAPYSS